MYLALCHPSDILNLSVEQSQYIPKVVLLRVYGDYIDYVWNKLPEHVKADSEVRTYRRCDEHYNQPWQRTHIDGPAPKIKDCSECRRRAARHSPFVIIDCSRQNESVKSGTVDVRLDFECKENVPANTTAYCLIIHDRVVQYNPLTNVVRKIT
ncbi:hypothetical protein ALC57_04920 [Trachymyrmex cornetzi]|uniref:Double jelly roll-like domain-containing protein n=1 Tax=Trachymyrmex cornetzi TaxID=471704 RepID=A0A151JC34_9HYME|nr:hypothetical protein ALC57_04920 [Trachymyrmex cornetzi]